MGWEKRGTHMYYYRKIRQGRRVISEYCGTGIGSLVDQCFLEAWQADRAYERLADTALRKQLKSMWQVDRQMARVEETICAICQGAMLVSGYHAHSRQWRKRRCHK